MNKKNASWLPYLLLLLLHQAFVAAAQEHEHGLCLGPLSPGEQPPVLDDVDQVQQPIDLWDMM
jgi:hypothetical protein